MIWRNVSGAAALASGLVLFVCAPSDPAQADCVSTGPSSYECSGSNSVAQSVGAGDVTTVDGFSVVAPDDSALTATGSADISYTDLFGSSLTSTAGSGLVIVNNGSINVNTEGDIRGSVSGLYITNGAGIDPAGLMSVHAGGTVTGETDTGAHLESWGNAGGVAADINLGEVRGSLYGVYLDNSGDGSVTLTTTGTVSADSAGIAAINVTNGLGTDVTINATDVLGGDTGINLNHYGVGSSFITVTGDVENTGTVGINATNFPSAHGMTIDVAGVSSGSYGIYATNMGSGALSIKASGKVAATAVAGTGILADNYGDGIDIDVQAVDGSIQATNMVAGNVTIKAAGDVASTDSFGIYAYQASGGKLDVEASNVSSNYLAINLTNLGADETTLTTTGRVSGDTGAGIFVQSFGNATLDVADVTGGDYGIELLGGGTGAFDVTIRGRAEGGIAGLDAYSTDGTARIEITGDHAELTNTAGLTYGYAATSSTGNVTIANNATMTGALYFSGIGSNSVSNGGLWNMARGSTYMAGTANTITNLAAGVLRLANDGGAIETSSFSGITSFTNQGVLSLQDGGAMDLLSISGEGGGAAAVTFADGSVFAVDVDAIGSSDLLSVFGTVDIEDGAKIAVTGQGAPLLGYAYHVLTASDGVTGSFGVVPVSAFLDYVATSDANDVYVTLTQVHSLKDLAVSPNEQGVVSVIPTSGAIYDALLFAPNGAAARGAYNALSGEVHGAIGDTMREDSYFARGAVLDALRGAFGHGQQGTNVGMAAGDAVAGTGPRVWSSAFGSWGETRSNGNAASSDRNIGGIFFGADNAVTDSWRLGLYAGYSRTQFDADSIASSAESDDYHAGVYGGTERGALALNFGAGYAWHDISSARNVAFPGFADRLTADYGAGTAQIFGEAAYRMDGPVQLQPFAGLAYVNQHNQSFTERGGVAALKGDSSTADLAFSTVGLRASKDTGLMDGRVKANGMVAWRHSIGDTTQASSLRFVSGGANYDVTGRGVARDAALVEAGFVVTVADNATLSASYDGQFSSGSGDHGARATFSLQF